METKFEIGDVVSVCTENGTEMIGRFRGEVNHDHRPLKFRGKNHFLISPYGDSRPSHYLTSLENVILIVKEKDAPCRNKHWQSAQEDENRYWRSVEEMTAK